MKKNIFIIVFVIVFIIGLFLFINSIKYDKNEISDIDYDTIKEQNIEDNESTEEIQEKLDDYIPILKNLGIVLDVPDKETKRAGDLLFDKKVVWEDGGSYSDKAFGDFGEMGKRKDAPNFPGVEYNFAVPIGTKIYAAGDGIANVFYIEHTKDWGVNIVIYSGSKWNIGHEHLVNLNVKDGDIVKSGDILGEATPNSMDYATTQLAVWTGGKEIIKYCPFLFLEDSLKPVYKEKINKIAAEWEVFTGRDVYEQEKWVEPGCLMYNITEN